MGPGGEKGLGTGPGAGEEIGEWVLEEGRGWGTGPGGGEGAGEQLVPAD